MFLQITKNSLVFEELFEGEQSRISFKLTGVGKGRSNTGSRRKWTKRSHFEKDLLQTELLELGEEVFTNKFAGCSPDTVKFIWNKIRNSVIRPREQEVHGRNKLLLWLHKLHGDLSWNEVSASYHIGVATAIGYVRDVLFGMMEAYKDSNIISFPKQDQRLRMVELNKRIEKEMPHALYTMDGKHARCLGARKRERRSQKYNFHPAFNALFVTERTFGTVCAFNLDESCRKHDITILRESKWFNSLELIANGWIIMADPGYLGSQTDNIAATMKYTSKKKRNQWSPEFWKELQLARADAERVFAHFFVNKFPQLANWKGKGPNAFKDWALNVTCGIIVYNELKLRHARPI